jgi:hypothetical protein
MCPLDHNECKELANDVKLIKAALLGNDFTQHKGIIHQMNELSERLEKIEKNANYKAGFFAGIGTLSGLILAYIIKKIGG